MNNSLLAFIPAKTGSTGLTDKIFRKIGSFSLLEWTLLAAYSSNCVTEMVVSSNDHLVEEAVSSFSNRFTKKRITFIQRPDNLCTYQSKTEEAICHMFDNYPFYQEFDYLTMLQATSPCRRNDLIDKCFNKMIETKSDSILTVTKCTPFFWKKSEDNQYNPLYSLEKRPMRQDISNEESYYHDNGNIYITKVEKFIENKTRVSYSSLVYPTPSFESMQIDTLEDFVVMNKLFNHYGSFL